MQKAFSQTFDTVKIGEECKQKLKDTLAEYQKNANASKIVKEKRKFQLTKWRIAAAASTAAVLIFCAIFIPLMAMNGGGGGTDMTATYKTQLLSAVSQLKTVESYTETIEETTTSEKDTIKDTYVTKYQKRRNSYIAEGTDTDKHGVSVAFYYADNYFYICIQDEFLSYPGLKYRYQKDMISINEFFSENSGYLTLERINQISNKTDFKVTAANGNTVYSFSTPVNRKDGFQENIDYTVIIENENGRILQINQKNTRQLGIVGLVTTMVASYDYTPVEVNLPDNLNEFLEGRNQ